MRTFKIILTSSLFLLFITCDSLIGPPGQDGQDGTDGIDGISGVNGTDGQDGQDGVDGIDRPIPDCVGTYRYNFSDGSVGSLFLGQNYTIRFTKSQNDGTVIYTSSGGYDWDGDIHIYLIVTDSRYNSDRYGIYEYSLTTTGNLNIYRKWGHDIFENGWDTIKFKPH